MGGLRKRVKMEKAAVDEEEGRTNEDHMNRLPDDLLIVIINNILEGKSLLNLSLVSKRFASLIPHHNGTVTVKSPDPSSIWTHQYIQFIVSFRRFLKQFGGTQYDTPYFPVTHDNTLWSNGKNLPEFSINAYYGERGIKIIRMIKASASQRIQISSPVISEGWMFCGGMTWDMQFAPCA